MVDEQNQIQRNLNQNHRNVEQDRRNIEQDRRNRDQDERNREVDRGQDQRTKGFRQSQYDLDTQIALLQQSLESFRNDITDIHSSLKEVRAEIKNITDMANKYRGGLLVVLALGGVIGTLVTISDKIVHWFH